MAANALQDKKAIATDKKIPNTTRKSQPSPASPMAAFTTSSEGSINILSVQGRLDPHSGKDFKDTINLLTGEDGTGDLLVDLEELTYMASAGFRELFLAGRKIGRNGGRLVVSSLRGDVKRVFELAGFDTAYKIFETREEALDYLRTPSV